MLLAVLRGLHHVEDVLFFTIGFVLTTVLVLFLEEIANLTELVDNPMLVQLVFSVLFLDVIDVVTHDSQLRQSGIVFTLLDCFLECVAHNGDQHVKESDLNHES